MIGVGIWTPNNGVCTCVSPPVFCELPEARNKALCGDLGVEGSMEKGVVSPGNSGWTGFSPQPGTHLLY